jgi:hypothetical protein
MKATISELWNTGREIISFDGSEFDRPSTFSDLKKCDNVLLGDKVYMGPGCRAMSVLIDDKIIIVSTATVRHPVGGTMYVLEIM